MSTPAVTPNPPQTSGQNPPAAPPPAQTQTQQPNAQQQPAQQPNPAMVAQVQQIQHDSNIGKAVQFLMGKQYDYQVDPQTGKTTPVEIQQKPGDLFRHIVAASILGGAVGAKQNTGLKGFVSGGAGAMQEDQQRDQQRREQAQQQFKNQLTAQNEQREQQSFKTGEDLKKAQLAMYNLQTVRENQLLQGESFKQHQETAAAGTAKLQPYINAGLNFAYKDVPESEMHTLLQKNPDAIHLDWEPTGTKVVMDKDGNPTYQLQYSAVDPNGEVKITPDIVKMFKDVGMDKYHPGMFSVLKTGKEVTATQFVALKNDYQTLVQEKTGRDKSSGDLAEQRARINRDNAETAKSLLEIGQLKSEISKDASTDSALKSLDEVGGDFTKIKPSERIHLTQFFNKQLDEARQLYKVKHDAGDEAGAEEQIHNIDKMQRLAMSAITASAENNPTSPPSTGAVKIYVKPDGSLISVPANHEQAFLQEFPGSKIQPPEKTALFKMKDGATKDVPLSQTSKFMLKNPKAKFVEGSDQSESIDKLRSIPATSMDGTVIAKINGKPTRLTFKELQDYQQKNPDWDLQDNVMAMPPGYQALANGGLDYTGVNPVEGADEDNGR
jgi:hypothetical protein